VLPHGGALLYERENWGLPARAGSNSRPTRPRASARRGGVSLTILSVAYPLAPVSPDAAGGAEQVLAMLDRGIVEGGHRSIVVAQDGSRVAGTLVPVPAIAGELDDAAKARAHARPGPRSARRWPASRSISFTCTGSTSTPICRRQARRRWRPCTCRPPGTRPRRSGLRVRTPGSTACPTPSTMTARRGTACSRLS
jgi:hypothetical protein